MSIAEKRFRERLLQRVADDVGNWFMGAELVYPVAKTETGDPLNINQRASIGVSKAKLAKFIYAEMLKQVPWLKEYKK